jgi:NADH-quinone oxidoreductase subunit G
MPKLTIDGQIIDVEDGLTIIQACELAGIEIPRFCYHEKLKIAGNCRMCLVDMEKSPKPVASCATAALDGMVIHTNSDKVRKLREGVLELLLINHPLDCPVCDQGGECDLQDITYKYAIGKSRFSENKRIVADKNMGPLIKTSMTRCIHCTRCIRFTTDIAGQDEIAAVGRGENMEITSYLEQAVTTELSGNIIDLCPVGALVSKPYAYQARSWELKSVETIDVLDALGSNIRVDSRGGEVMRVLPILNEDINEEWISDKTRFSYDGLKRQRIDRPYIKKDGALQEATWEEAIDVISQQFKQLRPEEIGAIAGTLVDCETMQAFKLLLNKIGCNNVDANQFNYFIDSTHRANYVFNSGVKGIEAADLCILVGANPRHASPVLNARIGQMVRAGRLKVARLGASVDQTYNIKELGTKPEILLSILKDEHDFCVDLQNAIRPMFILGDELLTRADAAHITKLIVQIMARYPNFDLADWNGFNISHNSASSVGALDLGFKPQNGSMSCSDMIKAFEAQQLKLLYLINADDIDIKRTSHGFIIYQGHHGSKGANIADVVLPSPAYTEKDAIYVNLEGRAQKAFAAIDPIGLAKYDWQIALDLAASLSIDLEFSSLSELRRIMAEASLVFAPENIGRLMNRGAVNISAGLLDNWPADNFAALKRNYYMTDVISSASINMANCIKYKLSEKVA